MSQVSEIVETYDSKTSRSTFGNQALRAFLYPVRCWRSRGLLWNFANRELQGRFRGSAGGIFWVLVHPIFLFTIFFFVFGILFAPRDDLLKNGPSTAYALYLFSGIIFFTAVLESTSLACMSVVTNGNLVKKVAFPCELLPLTGVAVSIAVYLVGCVVMLAIGIPLGDLKVGPDMLAWPILIVCLAVFSTGLGLILAAANVFARDVNHLYGIVGQAWFFLSPVFWRLPLVQDKAEALDAPWAVNILLANPIHCMLIAQRQVIGLGHDLPPAEYAANYYPVDLWTNIGVSALWAIPTFVVGYGFFMSRKHKFADLI